MKRAFRKSVFNGLVIGLTAGAFSAGAFASDKVINESFHPYKDQMPSHEGLSAGMTIDESNVAQFKDCLLYTSPSPRDRTRSRMPSSA